MREKQKNIPSRIQRIQSEIQAMDFVATGTLSIRRFSCGKKNCRCQKGPQWHHGPYQDWTHLVEGKFTHQRLTESQAETVKRAIRNYKQIVKLLRDWEKEMEKFLSI